VHDIPTVVAVQEGDAPVHLLKNSDVEIAKIFRYQKGDDLPPSVRQGLVAAGQTFQHQPDHIRTISLQDQVGSCRDRT